jgi:succinate-semialdehyde dehydrogenase/glutarate-semialdehyde dehydrogenase
MRETLRPPTELQSAAMPPNPAAAASTDAPTIDSVDPATNEVTARFAAAHPADLPALFAAARSAQKQWSAHTLKQRCVAIARLRDAVYELRDEIASVISRETGKPRVEAIFAEILVVLDTADFLSRQAPRWLRPERVPHHNLAMKAKSAWTEFHPHGLVAIISPWNYPFSIPMTQVISALVAGNAAIVKPSELTPACGALISTLVERAGLPAGLVHVLQGRGDLGAAIIDAHPDKVFFTGSVATGTKIAQACAAKLIPSVLELGGKDPMIVLADANLDIASSAAVWGGFMNCGETCISVERIYVEQPVADRFIELCVEKTKKLRLGPPADSEAEIGPMIQSRQLEKVEAQLRDAVARGACILTGGNRRPDLGPNFLEPAVVTDVDHSMDLMREETFGPVIAIRPVASADEAVALANDTPFALSASVWTGDAKRGAEIASRVRAGSVMVNDVASYYGISEAPHGGPGASGWGHSHGRLGLLEMVQTIYIDVDRFPRMHKPWWFGYTAGLAAAADGFVRAMFAPNWRKRLGAVTGARGAKGVVFRKDRL